MKGFERLACGGLLATTVCSVSLRAWAQDDNNGNGNGNGSAKAEASADAKSPAIPQVAANTPAGMFGAKGQLAISSDAGLSISSTSQSGEDPDSGSTTQLELRPSIDYFIIDNLSFGGFLGLNYLKLEGGHTTAISIGPRFGYNIAFSPLLSVWPKAGLSFTSTSQTIDNPPTGVSGDTNSSNLTLNLFVPVMLHPAQHFFMGFGPALDIDISGDVKTTVIAGRLTIGGWL